MAEKNKLRSWLYRVLSLLAVGPLVVVGTILVWHSLTTQQQYALAMQSTLSRQAADEIISSVEKVKNDLTQSMHLLDFSHLNKERQGILISTLRAMVDRNNRNIIAELMLLDSTGHQLARSSRKHIFLDTDLAEQSASPEFRIPMERDTTYYSPVSFDQNTGDPQMSISMPLHNIRSGKIEAILVAELRLKELWDIVTGLPIGESGIAYLLTESGRIIAHPNPSVVLRGATFHAPMGNGLHAGVGGNTVVLARESLRLGDQSFVIVTEMPLEEALRPTLHNIAVIALCIALAIIASSILGYLIIQRIVRPLGNISNAANAISDGDYSQAPIEAYQANEADDIGHLATTFNLMAERIQVREQDLRYAIQEAEAAAKVKDDFLATMSHEIRTPMNGVVGISQLLRETSLTDEQEEYLNIIDQSGSALLTILNDILDFSSIEAERLTLQYKPFNPRECVLAALNLMTPEAKHKELQLTLNYPDKDSTWLEGDEGRLRQVLLNLVSNAIKFSDQGEIKIEVELTKMGNGHCALRIHVQDTGIGIDDATLQNLFKPFTQGDMSSTRKYGGTGLGLAISKRLMNLMGGEIGVESIPGKGSSFWIAVTLAEAPAINLSGQASTASLKSDQKCVFASVHKDKSSQHYCGKILLVEDVASNQLLAKTILEQLGFEVFLATNGKEAIQQLEQLKCDLILMDCRMLEMDGYQATQIIRSQDHDTPIIAITANAMPYDRQRCLDAGMNDYLAKPFKKEDLASVLSQWLPSLTDFHT